MTEKKKPSAQRKAPAQREPVNTPSDAAPAPLTGSDAVAAIAAAIAEEGLPVVVIDATACPVCGTTKPENRCEVCGHQEHDT